MLLVDRIVKWLNEGRKMVSFILCCYGRALLIAKQSQYDVGCRIGQRDLIAPTGSLTSLSSPSMSGAEVVML